MFGESQEMKGQKMDEPDKVLQAEIEARRAALKEESEWRLNEWKRDFEAQVKAGLIDRGKLDSNFKARDIRRRPRRDEPVNEEVLRVAREHMLRDSNALMSAPPTVLTQSPLSGFGIKGLCLKTIPHCGGVCKP